MDGDRPPHLTPRPVLDFRIPTFIWGIMSFILKSWQVRVVARPAG